MIRERTARRLNVFILLGIFVVFLSLLTSLIVIGKNMALPHPNIGDPVSAASAPTPAIASASPGQRGNIDIIITNDELNDMLASNVDSQVSNLITEITSENIIIKGNLKNLFGFGFDSELAPSANNNELKLEILSAHIGILEVPKFIREQLSNGINLAVSNKINSYARVNKATLEPNKLILNLERKN